MRFRKLNKKELGNTCHVSALNKCLMKNRHHHNQKREQTEEYLGFHIGIIVKISLKHILFTFKTKSSPGKSTFWVSQTKRA